MKKLLALILAVMLSPLSAWAAFGSATAWDVRTTGSNTNGGAFDASVSSPGTDESQGSGTAISITLATGTTGVGSPVFSSTTHGPGNFVYIASGSGCSVGWYEVLSQSGGVATFDSTMGSATNVCVGTIGGSLATVAAALGECVGGNVIYIQSGTYAQTLTLNAGSCAYWDGYETTHNDLDPLAWTNWASASANFPLITTATNSTPLIAFTVNQTYQLQNLSLSNTAGTPSEGTYSTVHTPTLYFISTIFNGFSVGIDCIDAANDDCYPNFWNSEMKNTTGAYGIGSDGQLITVRNSYLHDNPVSNPTYGIIGGGTLVVDHSIISNSEAMVVPSGETLTLSNSTLFIGAGARGVELSTNSPAQVFNNVFYGGAYGFDCFSGNSGRLYFNTNAFGGQSLGATNGCPTTDPFQWINQINLSANPFVNSSSGNFAPNTTAGGGAALIGIPAIMPGGTTTATTTIGAIAASSGGGGGVTGPYGYVQ